MEHCQSPHEPDSSGAALNRENSTDLGALSGEFPASAASEKLGVSAALEDGNVSAAVIALFGDRADLARRYRDSLATAGVERGLIGPREVDRLWERHILNSAVVQELIEPGESVVDVGSGAGLPGIPLAIARPDIRVALVEPLLRRATYLNEIRDELGLGNVTVVRGRAEEGNIVREVGGADVVTSRAVAPLAKLAGWSLPLARRGGRMLALKGSSAAEELDRDSAALHRLGAGRSSIVLCGKGIIEPPTVVVVVENNVSRRTGSRNVH